MCFFYIYIFYIKKNIYIEKTHTKKKHTKNAEIQKKAPHTHTYTHTKRPIRPNTRSPGSCYFAEDFDNLPAFSINQIDRSIQRSGNSLLHRVWDGSPCGISRPPLPREYPGRFASRDFMSHLTLPIGVFPRTVPILVGPCSFCPAGSAPRPCGRRTPG